MVIQTAPVKGFLERFGPVPLSPFGFVSRSKRGEAERGANRPVLLIVAVMDAIIQKLKQEWLLAFGTNKSLPFRVRRLIFQVFWGYVSGGRLDASSGADGFNWK